MRRLLAATSALLLAALAPVSRPTVVRAFPHDVGAFTQGLTVSNGRLIETTGQFGESSLREVELASGRVLRRVELPHSVFGEGSTVLGNRIYAVTWTTGVGYVFDRASLKLLQTFRYPGEGWGLTHDGKRLILSDGTATLRFLDPKTLQETGRVEVTDAGRPIERLNELEFVRSEVWANVWETDRIARIDPKTGRVVGWIDLTGLISPAEVGDPRENVLNGIAYDAAADRLYVTGKRWPKIFEIRRPAQPR